MQKIWFYIIALFFFLTVGNASAHDINSNKISLIMREKSHISVVMNINLLKAMNHVVSPQVKYADFIMTFSNMEPKLFQREYEKTKTKIISGLIVFAKDQSKLSTRDWKWPTPNELQNQFQIYVMELMTGNHDHTKEPIYEITAEIIDKADKMIYYALVTAAKRDSFARKQIMASRHVDAVPRVERNEGLKLFNLFQSIFLNKSTKDGVNFAEKGFQTVPELKAMIMKEETILGISKPESSKSTNDSEIATAAFEGVGNHCNKKGHKKADCFKFKKEKESKAASKEDYWCDFCCAKGHTTD